MANEEASDRGGSGEGMDVTEGVVDVGQGVGSIEVDDSLEAMRDRLQQVSFDFFFF